MTVSDPPEGPDLALHGADLATLAAAAGLVAGYRVVIEPGPAGTSRVSLVPEGGYPGRGAMALLWDGRLFHRLLGRGISALADAAHWFERPPSAEGLLMAFGIVELGAPLFPDEGTTPELVVSRGQLELRAVARGSLDPDARRLEVVLTPYAPAKVNDAPTDEPTPTPAPIDDVTRWIRTIESGSLDSLAAVRSLVQRHAAGSGDPRPLAALVRVTTHWQEALWVESLSGLDLGDPRVARELAEAWSALDSAARSERLAVVAELFGSVPAELAGGGDER